ncbi:MAG: Fic family protein [Candidatus Diapherotrites archaeon]|jgi:Fic family protein|nr:Fic family protein [Candidatus Diapherotrites archaeon]MBT4596986.1 Fic family protein [Candidatus Diapherotrites archaeon]
MVYLAESRRGKNIYYYLVESITLPNKTRKQFRKYIGTQKPSEKTLESLFISFKKEIEKERKKIFGFHYLTNIEINEIDEINNAFIKRFNKLNPTGKEQFGQNFVNTFVFNSNSIEGSTLTAKEVALILEENLAPNKDLEDILEAKNAEKVLNYIKESKERLSDKFIHKLHELYFKDTKPHIAGHYKTRDNYVRNADFKTTPAKYVLTDMKNYIAEYHKLKSKLHPLELAAWAHWKFVKIHPFQDGNGRTSRVIMNYIIHQNGYQMIDIKTKEKAKYFKALDKCNKENSGSALAKLLVKRFKKQYKNALNE